MLRNRKRNRQGKEQNEDEFVEEVDKMHETQKKVPQPKPESQQDSSKLLKGVTKCDLGNSPETQTRELLKQ